MRGSQAAQSEPLLGPTAGEGTVSSKTMDKSTATTTTTTRVQAHVPQDSTGTDDASLQVTLSREPIQTLVTYKVYKRRWVGLLQLTLLNIIVSWDWLTFAPVSTSSAQYFGTTEAVINWLSTAFLLAFLVISPVVIWILNKGGPRPSMWMASALIFIGNWVRYAGTRPAKPQFGVVMLGQILIGLAQPFVLAAPTRYSDMWFTENGRIGATALASLANPLGGALGQLIDPAFCSKPADVPNMVLYVAIISTVCCLPSFILSASPPTPPSAASGAPKPSVNLATLQRLLKNPGFICLFIPFTIYVSCFNAISSLLNSILYPYGFSETAAGLTGALLIVVGLVTSAVTSPVLDRARHLRLWAVRVFVPVIAAMYIAWIFLPETRGDAAPYAVSAVLGAASFALVPLALELLVDVSWPESPEVSSVVCWSAGQLGGAICIIIMDALAGVWPGQPAGNMKAGLVFLAVFACLAVPAPMFLGVGKVGLLKRDVAERMGERIDDGDG